MCDEKILATSPRNGTIQMLRRVAKRGKRTLVRGDGAPTGDLLTNVFEKAIHDRGRRLEPRPLLWLLRAAAACAQCFVWGTPSQQNWFSGLRMQIWRLDSLCSNWNFTSAAQGVVNAELSNLFSQRRA